MAKNDSFDVVIIGAGQAGIPLAFAFAKTGKRTALVERLALGGSCVNFGCTPTKAVIASARVAHLARHAGEYGVSIDRVSIDFAKVMGRAKKISDSARESLEKSFKGSDNPTLIPGEAQITGRKGQGFEIAIGDMRILAAKIVLDTGTRSHMPDVPGLDRIEVLHSENWLEHTTLPSHLVMLGGGAIGLEMAQFYRRMGSQVTILENGPLIASSEDDDVAKAIAGVLEGEGISIKNGVKILSVESLDAKSAGGARVRIAIQQDGKKLTLEASDLFVATGRAPNTDGLGLETIGVERDAHGFVKVNDRLHTSIPGIFAAGDIRGGPMFTHTAWDDHRVLLPQLAAQHGKDLSSGVTAQHEAQRTTERIVPYAIFVDPELGRVGLTEKQAKAGALQVRVARYDIAHNGKAIELGETTGFIKVLVDRRTDLILGGAVFAPQGGELVHILVDAMNARESIGTIRNAVYIHPTLAEAVQSAVERLAHED